MVDITLSRFPKSGETYLICERWKYRFITNRKGVIKEQQDGSERNQGEIPLSIWNTSAYEGGQCLCKELCAGDGTGSEGLWLIRNFFFESRMVWQYQCGSVSARGGMGAWVLCAFLYGESLWRPDRPFCVLRIRILLSGNGISDLRGRWRVASDPSGN